MSEKRQPRRKTPLACQSCRNRRTKCDGSMPVCQACQRRGFDISQCVYTIENARTANRDTYIQSLHDRIRSLEQTIEQNGIGGSPAANPANPALSRAAETGSFRDPPSPIADTVTESYRSVQHRTAEIISPESLESVPAGLQTGVTAMGTLDHDGDISGVVEDSDHFYGSSSAASFMRQAVESANGSAYSPHGTISSPLETSIRHGQAQTRARSQGFTDRAYSDNYSLPPRSLADHLLNRFWEKVYYLYPVFHKPAFEDAYRHLWEAQGERNNASERFPDVGLGSPPDGGAHTMLFQCALNIIFAIGVSFSDIPPAEKEAAARTFFLRAKSFIGLDMLDINNIGLAQVMLLVTVFLQSTPFPSRCWYAIGIACRVAQGLGLHTYKPRRGESQLETEISRRTWQGCVILDMTVSMTLGRPAMTTHLPEHPATVSCPETSTEAFTSAQEQGRLKMIFFVEYYRLCHLLKDILGQVYQGGNNGPMSEPTPPGRYADDPTAILQLERRLLVYEDSLPPILSWQRPMDLTQVSPTMRATTETQRLVLHRRFLYLRILLWRPVFTQFQSSNKQGPMPTSLYKSFVLQCAKNCVQSSIDLIQVVYQTHRKVVTEWWWDSLYACTSGLVLILNQLYTELRDCFDRSVIQEHWQYCEAVLDHLSGNSISVRRSLELLRRLHDRIMPNFTANESGTTDLAARADNPGIDSNARFLEPVIGELVETLPFQMMNNAEMSDMTFDWNQCLDVFDNTENFVLSG